MICDGLKQKWASSFGRGDQVAHVVQCVQPGASPALKAAHLGMRPDVFWRLGFGEHGDHGFDGLRNVTVAKGVAVELALMQSGGDIELNIKRNGKNETINYSFN